MNTSAEELKNNGNKFFDKDDYGSALVCYNEAVELEPNLWAVYITTLVEFIKD